ncbi:glycoside hydrolase family 3 protein [Pluteus cervinus]|uniref:Glycoside hydrolase family 3 protein n=1 Tax=Pluteus cervinus TaxID=181527 RepID=A0ACD3ANG4_9AGAR|nr:glycoside hydrolase family 3 protein [Pluteus cervinus]
MLIRASFLPLLGLCAAAASSSGSAGASSSLPAPTASEFASGSGAPAAATPVTSAAPTASATLIPTVVSSPGALAVTTGVIASSLGYSSLVPVVPYTFSPFPVPSQPAAPNAFPAVDPSKPPPPGSTLIPNFQPAWSAAWAKAKKKVEKFSLEEKISVATGTGWENGRCLGDIPPIEPVNGRGWPGLCLEDSPLGVRNADYVTGFPAAINAAATWNRTLIRERGLYIGREHRGKGVNFALGPMTNMGRIAQGGRNWEGFGADPFLSGESTYETVLGMQESGVGATVKHLVGNEQEYKRTQETSDIDDRTMHEIYAHPFLRSVMAGVTSMMCSYNLVNNTYACENDKVMNDIIKREYGFQGFIMSDWQATHSTISPITGLDMSMPGDIVFNSGTTYFGSNLTSYVQNSTIPESRIDDMAIRIIASWYFLHQDSPSYPSVNFDAFKTDSEETNEHIDVQADHYKLVRTMGAASTVLLKNTNNALPLKSSLRSLVIIGSDGGPGRTGPNAFVDQGGDVGVLAMGWGSGTANFTYLSNPLDAIQARARQSRTSVNWLLDDWDVARAGNLARKKGAAIVFINSDSGEQYITVDGNQGDRNNLTAWHNGDNLVLAVAAQNNNTIVVAHSVGPLILEPWIDHPNVTALLWAGLPGEEAGNSIADVLFGDFNPSGRLPYTIAKDLADYSAQRIIGGRSQDIIAIPYTEGLEIDYRHFDAKNITPRYEFGFGLSYTAFGYSNLKITKLPSTDRAQSNLISAWEDGKASPIVAGSSSALWLHRPAYQVTFSLRNTGKVAGGEIPQLYLNFPPSANEPPNILKGFTDVLLKPGESETVTIYLSRYDLSIWDVVKQGWVRPSGSIGVSVGASSRDLRLKGKIPS